MFPGWHQTLSSAPGQGVLFAAAPLVQQQRSVRHPPADAEPADRLIAYGLVGRPFHIREERAAAETLLKLLPLRICQRHILPLNLLIALRLKIPAGEQTTGSVSAQVKTEAFVFVHNVLSPVQTVEQQLGFRRRAPPPRASPCGKAPAEQRARGGGQDQKRKQNQNVHRFLLTVVIVKGVAAFRAELPVSSRTYRSGTAGRPPASLRRSSGRSGPD